MQQTGGTGTFHFNGGTLQAGGDNTAFMQGLTTADVQAGGAIIDTQGFNVTVAQTLTHSTALGGTADGGLTKNGAGTLTLTGNNAYSGTTYVAGGALMVNNVPVDGVGSGTGSGSVFVGQGAWLGGTGFIGGDVIVGSAPTFFPSPLTVRPQLSAAAGTLTPGVAVGGVSTPGILTFNGSLTLLSGVSKLEIDLAGVNPGKGYDQVKVNGSLNLGGTLTLTLGSGFEPTPGEKFYLIAYTGSAGISGTFDGLGQGAMVEDSAGNEYVINYLDSTGNGAPGSDVSITFVPEPGTWALLGLGAAVTALGVARRRVRA